MKISTLSQIIVFEKSTVTIDENANHKNTWTEYFKCHAYASSYSQQEQREARVTVTDNTLVFTVRWCSELASIDSTNYRIRFLDMPWNITAIDQMNYQHKTIKVTCERERRDS